MLGCRNWFCCLLFVALSCLALSCSPQADLNPVRGKVIYNGAPLGGATVTLVPEGGSRGQVDWPLGITQDDGTFTLKTGDADGAPVGKYRATITCPEPAKTPTKSMEMSALDTVDRLKGAYADPETSKITVEINTGTNDLQPFQLP